MTPIADARAFADIYDIVVIGAGPAGLAAAATASDLGLSTVLIDENPAPGGQIYRAITTTPMKARAILGEDYWKGAGLVARVERSSASYAARCTVWSVGDGPRSDGLLDVGVSQGGKARMIAAREVIVATGAQERPFPIPGWTLPGVMTAGAAQIALKTSGAVPAGRVVVAGCGPLLYLLAGQLAAAGATVVAMLDTTSADAKRAALPAALEFMRSPYLAKGLALMAQARRRIRFVNRVTSLAALGETRVSAARFARGGGVDETIACDALLLHQGVVPSTNLSNAIGCAHEFDADQHCWRPRLDAWFSSSVPGVSIAGDGAGVGGAESAALRGEIAALGAAARLGQIHWSERDARSAPIRAALARALRGRRFLDLLYKPAPHFLSPRDDSTIVCRCEEVTAGQIRDAARRLGVTGPNQMKAFLRCGMGPCQGRLCGSTVAELIAQTRDAPLDEVGTYRLRPPVKPVTLGELAALPKTEEAIAAVDR